MAIKVNYLPMSMRTGNHMLEDESRNFFKRSLPRHWVSRDKSGDYGIDCEVEIFTDCGNPTGLVFWAQLKATDSEDLKDIKSIYFKREKIDQLFSYEIPTLIVRYTSKNECQYIKWARSLYFEDADSKGLTVRFNDAELWTATTAGKIERYLLKYTSLRTGTLPHPVKTYVGKALIDNYTEIPFSNVLQIRQALLPRYFENVINPDDSSLQIFVMSDRVVITLSDVALTLMKISFEKLKDEDREQLGKYLLLHFCTILLRSGRDTMACQITMDNALISVLVRHQSYLMEILPSLFTRGYIIEVLQNLECYFKDPGNDNILMMITQVALLSTPVLSEKEEQAIERFLQDQLETALKRGIVGAIATANYNLGSYYRNRGRGQEAFKYYVRAKKVAPNYKLQPYFAFEMGGILFQLERFRFSEIAYSKAIELKADAPLAPVLLAHALMYGGKYREACDTLEAFLDENGRDDAIFEWHLWYTCLATLLEIEFPATQTRDAVTAAELCKAGKYEEALEYDMLSNWAWYNLGIQSADSQNRNAMIAFTFAGLLCISDIDSWVNATLCAYNERNPLFILIVQTAHHFNSQNYINRLSEKIKAQTLPETYQKLIEIVDSFILEKPKAPLIVRVFEGGGSYTTIEI